MKILATITPVFQPLVDNWLAPSLAKLTLLDSLVVVVDHSPNAQGTGDFRSHGFDAHIANKLELVATWAEREARPFLVTDADVIYLRPFADALGEISGLDLLLAREWPDRLNDYNIGQMVVSPSAGMAHFLRSIAAELRKADVQANYRLNQPSNQEHFNKRLLASNLRHGSLPKTFAHTAMLRHLGRTADLHSYHATETYGHSGGSSLEQKQALLSKVTADFELRSVTLETEGVEPTPEVPLDRTSD